MQTPRDVHLDSAKRVLRYVSGTMDYDILYESATPIQLKGFNYVDWASNTFDIHINIYVIA